MGKKLTDADKKTLEQLQPVQEVLRALVIALAQADAQSMPTAARALRNLSCGDNLSLVAVAMMYDLADSIDRETGVDTES